MPGQTVELTGAGPVKTAKTDEAGRATFNALPPGARVKVAVTVDGERVESQEFAVPAVGGIALMLVATDAGHREGGRGPRSRRRPRGPGASVVLGEQSRFVIEVGDDALNVFNLLQIVNTAKQPVQTAGPLVFELPRGRGRRGHARRIAVRARSPPASGHGDGPVRSRQHAGAVRLFHSAWAARRSSSRRRCRRSCRRCRWSCRRSARCADLAAAHRAARDGGRTARPSSSARAGRFGPAIR